MSEGQAARDALIKWAERDEYQTSITNWLPAGRGRPLYAYKEIGERVEPWATRYDALTLEHPDHGDEGEPDPEFYRPTRKLRQLDRKLTRLRTKGFRMVPNPDYDPVRAAEWEVNQTQVYIGQSYNPFVEEVRSG